MARILVVEDDPIQLDMRRQILEHAGYEVVRRPKRSRGAGAPAGVPGRCVMDLRIPAPEDGRRLIEAIAGAARDHRAFGRRGGSGVARG